MKFIYTSTYFQVNDRFMLFVTAACTVLTRRRGEVHSASSSDEEYESVIDLKVSRCIYELHWSIEANY